MAYNFTLRTTVGRWHVEVDPVAHYGYFENVRTGTGGGLWFSTNNTLEDYDGVGSLPCAVIGALDDFGLTVLAEFE